MQKRAKAFKTAQRQLGQGMSEYIIITALIALSAIAVVGAFGGVIQQDFHSMAQAMAGESPDDAEATDVETDDADLGTWQDKAQSQGGGGGG